MALIIYAAAGGALGAGMRFLAGHLFAGRTALSFPWVTLSVNVIGCFLMGVLIAWLASRPGTSLELRTFLATGVLGGFTTFSAFAIEFATLFERGESMAAAGYVVASVILSLVAVFVGLAVARWVLS